MKKYSLKYVFDEQSALLPIEQRTYTTNEGSQLVVIDGGSSNQYVTVRFIGPVEYETELKISNVLRGKVKYLYHPSVYGIGYVGIGPYKLTEQSKSSKIYAIWRGMLQRSYCQKEKIRFPTYNGVTVCLEWHNFQTFAKWFYEESNYQEDWQLDKDLLVKGNKEYGPNACVFIPHALNTFLGSNQLQRHNTSGVAGVYWSKLRKKWIAQISINSDNSTKNLGIFEDKQDAIDAYEQARKEQLLIWKDLLKDQLPEKALDALSS